MAQAVKTFSDASKTGANICITTLNGLPSIPSNAVLDSVILTFTCYRKNGKSDNEIRIQYTDSTTLFTVQDLAGKSNDTRSTDITSIVNNNGGTLTYKNGSTSLDLRGWHDVIFINATWELSGISITANYTIPTYTLTVTSNNTTYGTVTGGGTYDVGASATLTATPNTGYRFVKWNDDNTDNPRTVTVTGNATYTATFESSKFYVYFSGYGATSGVNSAPSTITATYGKSYTLPTPGTTFHKQVTISWNGNADDATLSFTERTPLCYCIGWKRDPNTSTMYQPGESVNIEPTTEGGNVTFYATWGATSTDNPIATRPGYRLKEWNTKADGSGTAYTGDTIETSDDITLYAQWEKSTCTLTVISTSDAYGTVTGGGTYDVGATATITATPNTGYKFVQWGDGNTSATRTFTVSADATYIARFEPITYYVAFEGNGATSGSVATLTVKYGETFYLPENGFTKKVTLTWEANGDGASVEYREDSQNCAFMGWKVGSETKSPGTNFTNYTSTDGQTITFYADWDYCLFTNPTATRKGYKLKEWNTKADGSGQTYPISRFYSQTTLTLYAQWEKAEPVFTSVTITRSTDLAQVTINTPVDAGAKYIISVEVT